MDALSQPFLPQQHDIHVARAILKSLLPMELVLAVLDFACYWAEATHEDDHHIDVVDPEYSLDFSAAICYTIMDMPMVRRLGDKMRIKVIEFSIYSYDQGWTSEDTKDTYKTSSWFEVSILRRNNSELSPICLEGDRFYCPWEHVELSRDFFEQHGWSLIPRPSADLEFPRMHCPEMKSVTWPAVIACEEREDIKEGRCAWYLQGNQVANEEKREQYLGTQQSAIAICSVEGNFKNPYRVIWGGGSDSLIEGNEGAGEGKGFVDALEDGDRIVVWARAKRRGWENNVRGIRITIRYTI